MKDKIEEFDHKYLARSRATTEHKFKVAQEQERVYLSAKAEFDKANALFEGYQAGMVEKYGLKDGDQISEGGEIIRKEKVEVVENEKAETKAA